MKLEKHPRVLTSDLPAIYAFIARDNPPAAERVLDAAMKGCELLARQPALGVSFRTRNPQLSELRMLPVPGFANYLIIYCVTAAAVRVLYVVHGARHLPRLLQRDSRR